MTPTTKLQRIAAKCRELLALGWGTDCAKAGWRATLAAIDWLDGMTPQVREAVENEIITAWPDELL